MITTAANAVKNIQSGHNIFIHSGVAAPQCLVNAMSQRHTELKNVSIYQIHTEGDAPYAQPELANTFTIKALFVGANIRQSIQQGISSYIPVFLSEVPALFQNYCVSNNVECFQK